MKEQGMMKTLFLEAPSKFAIRLIPIPKPKDGEVLIKVMAAPINPSDLSFFKKGNYSTNKKAPCPAGFEGSGLVVQNGGGIFGWGLVNKKVAFTPIDSFGSYSQYALAKSSQCFPVDQKMSYQQASMSFVNPLTAIAMLDLAKEKKVKAVVINAAASSLGRMLNRFLPPQGIQIINIVRKKQQVDVLRNQGANHIINSSEPDYEENLKNISHELKATVCFDAIGGTSTGQILKNMPRFSTIYVYGVLSGENVTNIDALDILRNHKTVTGLFLSNWLEEKGFLKLIPSMVKLRKLLLKELRSEISKQVSIDDFTAGLDFYIQNMTKGKVIIKPWLQAEKNDEKIQKKEQNQTIKEQNKKQEEPEQNQPVN